jgi:hypothetical protein
MQKKKAADHSEQNNITLRRTKKKCFTNLECQLYVSKEICQLFYVSKVILPPTHITCC